MRCAKVRRAIQRPFRIEPEVGQVTEHPTESVSISNESWDVLHDDVSGSHSAKYVSHPGPSPTLVSGAELLAGVAERLAGETSADDVNGWPFCAGPPVGGGADVVVTGNIGPVASQDGAAERVDLDLADRGHAGALET